MPDPTENPPMIYRTAYDTATGQLRWVAFGVEGLIDFPEEPGLGWVDGEWLAATHYVLGGVVTARPATGLPATHSMATSTDWAVPDVPEGTDVLVDGAVAGTVDAGGLVLSFGLAGVWHVELRPPFPWLAASCEVIVT